MNDDNDTAGITRRSALTALVLATAGCSGDGNAPDAESERNAASAGADNSASRAFVPGKHRFQQARLFQRAHAKIDPFKYTNSKGELIHSAFHDIHYDLVGGAENCHRMVGASAEYLCWVSRWPWKNRNGDYVDATGQRQGTTPFKTVDVPKNTSAGQIEIDALGAFRHIASKKTWAALLLKVSDGGGTLKLNGVLRPGAPKSQVELKYSDGSSETLQLWYTGSALQSTAYVNAHEDEIHISPSANGFIEFDRPVKTHKTLSAATLRLTHAGTDALTLSLFVIAPLLPKLQPEPGIAASQPFDAGVEAHPKVLVTQLIKDSTVIEDVLDTVNSGSYAFPYNPDGPKPLTQRQEAFFDPTLWGQPPLSDDETAKLLPRRNFGKWVGYTSRENSEGRPSFSVVKSSYASHGFVPMAPGLGAIHLVMPKRAPPNGTTWRADGESGTDVDLWLPRAHIGRVRRIRFRYYVLLGDGWEARDDQLTLHFLHSQIGKYPEEVGYTTVDSLRDLTARPSDNSGKMFGGAQHVTSGVAVKDYVHPTRVNDQGQADDSQVIAFYGGGYGASSGGDVGYQGRLLWSGGFHKKLGGPAEGGLTLGLHLYDMQNGRTAPSQMEIKHWDSGWKSSFSHNGGLGHIYKDGRWRCVEFEWRLNPNRAYQLPPRGTHFAESGSAAPPTGYLRAWVDGVLAAETPEFGFSRLPKIDWALQNAASAPFDSDPGSPARIRPMTAVPDKDYLGFASLAGNLYYGGRSPCPVERHLFINGLVVAIEDAYIGPMAGVSRDHGGLGV